MKLSVVQSTIQTATEYDVIIPTTLMDIVEHALQSDTTTLDRSVDLVVSMNDLGNQIRKRKLTGFSI